MSNSADFSIFQIPTPRFDKFLNPDSHYFHPETQSSVHEHVKVKPRTEPKHVMGIFTDRTDDLLSQSTNDSPLKLGHASRLDDSIFSPTIPKRKASIECQHVNFVTKRCTYCKDCGVFLPTNGSTVYRENTYNEKITTCPDEIYSIMLQNQTKNREYHENAPHLEVRKTITDWIYQVSQDLKLSPDTTCAVISYLDTILCREEVSKENLQLVTLSCLIIATKFLEMDSKVPPLREAYNLAQGIYSIDTFKKAETYILEQLDWNLRVISPYQFVHFFLSRGCVFSSDKTTFGDVDTEILKHLHKYSECFVNYSLDDYKFNQFSSHVVACAAIASTRKMLGISPIWNPELEELTGVTWENISPCFDLLYGCFEISFPELLDFSKVFIEKKESAKNNESHIMLKEHENPIKETEKTILKKAISSKKKELLSSRKQLKKKLLARFHKRTPVHDNSEAAVASESNVN